MHHSKGERTVPYTILYYLLVIPMSQDAQSYCSFASFS